MGVTGVKRCSQLRKARFLLTIFKTIKHGCLLLQPRTTKRGIINVSSITEHSRKKQGHPVVVHLPVQLSPTFLASWTIGSGGGERGWFCTCGKWKCVCARTASFAQAVGALTHRSHKWSYACMRLLATCAAQVQMGHSLAPGHSPEVEDLCPNIGYQEQVHPQIISEHVPSRIVSSLVNKERL